MVERPENVRSHLRSIDMYNSYNNDVGKRFIK